MILRRLARPSQALAPRTAETLVRLSAHVLRAPRAPSVPNPSFNSDPTGTGSFYVSWS